MPIPDNFSSWEHLQNVLIKVHNREVKQEFNDITDDDDISVARGNLKVACLLKDSDTAEMTVLRMMLFWFNLRKAQDLQGHFYGQLIQEVQATRKYKPQVKLFFIEKLTGAEEEGDYAPVPGEISFRLMNESSATLSKTNLITIGNKIKLLFGGANPEKWKKGKDLASYTDHEKGYQLQLLVRNKTDAKALITKILDIQNHIPEWKHLNYKENDLPTDAYPILPGTQTILGKTYKKPRVRPIAEVVFQYATLWYSRSYLLVRSYGYV
jgi:hypothetical protein